MICFSSRTSFWYQVICCLEADALCRMHCMSDTDVGLSDQSKYIDIDVALCRLVQVPIALDLSSA
jgi:hypothetical protein